MLIFLKQKGSQVVPSGTRCARSLSKFVTFPDTFVIVITQFALRAHTSIHRRENIESNRRRA